MTSDEALEVLGYLLGHEKAVDSGEMEDVQNCLNSQEQEALKVILSEFRELKEINEKITEAVNGQLIAGKNNYKEAYECFHKIVDIVQGRIDWSEGKE